MSDNVIMICGKSATGKSASLMFLENQESVMYLRCEPKKLPFKHNFMEFVITDPYQVHQAFDKVANSKTINTIVIDSSTFLMDMFESKHILTLADKMKGWQGYQTFWKILMQEKVASTTKNVIILAHTKDQLNEKELAMETFIPVKGALSGVGIESYFSCVIAAKKVPLTTLKPYENDMLTITPEEEALGYKHCFQTRLTKETVGERLRGPLGLFATEFTYINNNCQFVINRLHSYYGT